MKPSELSPAQVTAMLHLIADRIILAEPELSEADRRLGDGDHGIGMKRGMEAAKAALDELPEDATIGERFGAHGKAMMSSMGGASGVVFGTLFRGAAKPLKASPSEFTSHSLAAWLPEAADSIMKRGGAKPGDKTMLDALVPAGEVAVAASHDLLPAALEKIAQAAEDGRDASKALIATMGRAKTLGEKSIGHPDAGACSIAIVMRTMSDFVNDLA